MLPIKDDKYKEVVDRLTAAYSTAQRGQVITWSAIEAIMERGRYDEGGMTIINRFRKRLRRDREIVTLASTTVGLRLLTHEETAREVFPMRQRKAYRQVNRAIRETATVPGDALPDRLRLSLAQQRMHLKQQRLDIGRARRQMLNGNRRSQTHPVRRMPATVK